VGNLLETRALHLRVEGQKSDLEKSQNELIERLSAAVTLSDTKQSFASGENTNRHAQRVATVAQKLAEALQLPPTVSEMLGRAALLHDVGRIGIPDEIILKPGQLTPEELEIVRTHTTLGGRLLAGGKTELLQMAEQIALTHHERWDGTGYPAGLKGEAIPTEGRIVAVAEVFDALTHRQPFREAWGLAAAVREIEQQSGKQFDPAVVEAFKTLKHRDLL
jgi:putative two-component system response regulator